MTRASLVALSIAATWWRASAHHPVLQFIVCAAAILLFLRAFEARQYFWMVMTFAIAVVFNPIVPLNISAEIFLWIDLACLLLLALSTGFVHAPRLLTVQSVVDLEPRREAL
jgi:hypothetical protein